MFETKPNCQIVTYLFDPLCGWCYGAEPMLEQLRETGVAIELVPTGLFSGSGARPMDDNFAAHAWSNDQRIERLSGQIFSETYRSKVLGASNTLVDSGPSTLALTAVALSEPERELGTLKAIQHARYVEGLDITSLPSLIELLTKVGLGIPARRVAAPDAALVEANDARIARGRQMIAAYDAKGVPALVVSGRNGTRLLTSTALFGSIDNLVSHLRAA